VSKLYTKKLGDTVQKTFLTLQLNGKMWVFNGNI